MTKMPKKLPMEFLEDYYRNCEERELYKEQRYTEEEYWHIWKKFKQL